jgi:hypothetical protein
VLELVKDAEIALLAAAWGSPLWQVSERLKTVSNNSSSSTASHSSAQRAEPLETVARDSLGTSGTAGDSLETVGTAGDSLAAASVSTAAVQCIQC